MQNSENNIYLEIGREGIARVFVISGEDDVDGQSDAHQLLAQITPHLDFDNALKNEGGTA